MSPLQFPREMIFLGRDFERPRMTVESEKLQEYFPQFDFYGSRDRVTSIQGWLDTSYGNSYYVRIDICNRYPYELPTVWLPDTSIEDGTGHVFRNGDICVMRKDQWSSTLSLACLVAKTALWLNKYDSWLGAGKGKWPGKGQRH